MSPIEAGQAMEPGAVSLAPHAPLTQYYPGPSCRSDFVTDLFDSAAPDYDWMSGLMSLWTDRWYRRMALRRAGVRPGMKLLDVASGTGLVARAALEVGIAPSDLVGLDPSAGMLRENRLWNRACLVRGRGECLPFGRGSFDFIVMGYALRHVEDLVRLFGEFHRVLRSPGRVLILEITRPASGAGARLFRVYMKTLLTRLTRLRCGNVKSARLMEYYWATIDQCVPPARILSALASAGFQGVRQRLTGTLLSEYLAAR